MKHYDKIILLAALLILGASALFLLLRLETVEHSAQHERAVEEPVSVRRAELLDVDEMEDYLRRMTAAKEKELAVSRMMVSDLRVACVNCARPIRYHAEICPFCNFEQPEVQDPDEIDSIGDGIPDAWARKHGIDPFDPRAAHTDLDGDGFTVLEEYRGGTDPNDPEDFPPPAAKLRMADYRSEPFMLRFEGVQTTPSGARRFLLNLRSGERSHFVGLGDTVEGFTVQDYEEIIERAPDGRRTDKSVLVLEQAGSTIRLIRDEPLARYERTAELVFLIDGSRYDIGIDDTIELRDEVYKVVDISRDEVLIRDVSSEQTTRIGRLSESERRGLEGRGGRRDDPLDELEMGREMMPGEGFPGDPQ